MPLCRTAPEHSSICHSVYPSVCGKVSALHKRIAVNAFGNCRVSLVRADMNAVQTAVILCDQVVFALRNRTFDISILFHLIHSRCPHFAEKNLFRNNDSISGICTNMHDSVKNLIAKFRNGFLHGFKIQICI